MKKTLLFIAVFALIQQLFSQEKYNKPFFTTSIATTLAVNENYTLDSDDGEPFLLPNSLIARIGLGYQLHRRVLVSLHAGFDHHWGFKHSLFLNNIHKWRIRPLLRRDAPDLHIFKCPLYLYRIEHVL